MNCEHVNYNNFKKRNETGDGDSESDQNNRKLMQNYHHAVDEIIIVYAMVMVLCTCDFYSTTGMYFRFFKLEFQCIT